MAHGVEQAQPTVLPLTGGGGVVKDKLSPGQQLNLLAGEGGQVGLEPPAVGLVGAEQQYTATGHGPGRSGDVGPVDAGHAGYRHRTAARLNLGHQLGKFRLLYENFG